MREGDRNQVRANIDETLEVAAGQTAIGFHLLDRIDGTRFNLHARTSPLPWTRWRTPASRCVSCLGSDNNQIACQEPTVASTR